MKQILKFDIVVGPITYLNLRPWNKIVHVGDQRSTGSFITMWAESDLAENAESAHLPDRQFIVLPTGAEVPDCYEHRGTVICAGGALVWHLYEIHG